MMETEGLSQTAHKVETQRQTTARKRKEEKRVKSWRSREAKRSEITKDHEASEELNSSCMSCSCAIISSMGSVPEGSDATLSERHEEPSQVEAVSTESQERLALQG